MLRQMKATIAETAAWLLADSLPDGDFEVSSSLYKTVFQF